MQNTLRGSGSSQSAFTQRSRQWYDTKDNKISLEMKKILKNSY